MAGNISSNTVGDTTTISIVGEFCFDVNKAFRDAYKTKPDTHQFTINLSGVSRMDSAALGMLIQLREFTKNKSGVVLSKPSTEVSQILQIANFQSLFSIEN